MIVPGMFVCSSFLISVCMFIVSKALLISSATVIVREGGAIWLNPFATVLFSVCSAMHLALWYVVLVCHQYDVCENSVGSVYVGGYGGLSESGLCVFCKSCPVCFLVVGKGPSVLL